MDYNLYDINTIKKILSKYGFTFSKALGQNFLIDSDVCPKMAESLNADDKTGVLEIGHRCAYKRAWKSCKKSSFY